MGRQNVGAPVARQKIPQLANMRAIAVRAAAGKLARQGETIAHV